MQKIVQYFVELPKWLHNPLWRIWHNVINWVDQKGSATFLNYGYEGEKEEFSHIPLSPQQEFDRYSIQLYCHTARHHSFPNTEVLEVGCGRGGGAAFLAKTFQPNSYTAVDINPATTKFCNRFHQVPGLRFLTANAEELPFQDRSFDAVINVESARCYPDMEKFFREAYRLLKPGGKFLFADMIKPNDLDQVESRLLRAGFEIMEKKDVRPNVVASLKADTQNRKSLIDKKAPGFLQSTFYEFAGVQGTNRFDIFNTGEMGYWSYTLIKK